MNIYDKVKLLRDQYLNDIDYEVKLSILSQIICATFCNNDSLPKIMTITFDSKIILKMNRMWRNPYSGEPYPFEVLAQVLNDLELEFNFNNCCHCSAFTFSFEVNFFNP